MKLFVVPASGVWCFLAAGAFATTAGLRAATALIVFGVTLISASAKQKNSWARSASWIAVWLAALLVLMGVVAKIAVHTGRRLTIDGGVATFLYAAALAVPAAAVLWATRCHRNSGHPDDFSHVPSATAGPDQLA